MKVLGWILYVTVGVALTLGCFVAGQLWFALALALCFIFGPKLWRSM